MRRARPKRVRRSSADWVRREQHKHVRTSTDVLPASAARPSPSQRSSLTGSELYDISDSEDGPDANGDFVFYRSPA